MSKYEYVDVTVPVEDGWIYHLWRLGYRSGAIDKRRRTVSVTTTDDTRYRKLFWRFYWRIS